MKKTKVLLVMLLMSLVVTVSAMSPIRLRINGETLECFGNDTKLDVSLNVKFLKGVYCGSTSDLEEEEIFITQFKQSDNYVIAVLRADYDYYVVTYKSDGGIIDGALLLRKDDITCACDPTNPKGNKMSAGTPEIDLKENMVSVTRKYVTYVNVQDMGVETTERGSVTMEYEVDKSGIISKSKSGNKQHAVWNEEVPGRGNNSTDREKCQTLGDGMEVINFCTNPVSKENKDTPNKLESLLKKFNVMLNDFGDNMSMSSEGLYTVANCIGNLETQLEGMVLRNPQLWLSWLNKHPKSKCMETIKKSIGDDEDFKSALQQELKSLKDNKLRKAWEKRIK
ncbi:MAG: hypothetical protein IK100_04035 [Muribaculaceae bacterium]|nr:hypothetical protein [Muribaculaceae bacterium]